MWTWLSPSRGTASGHPFAIRPRRWAPTNRTCWEAGLAPIPIPISTADVDALLHLAAALGARDRPLIEERMARAVEAGFQAEAGELALMAVFVTGFPAGLDASRMWAAARTTPPPDEPSRPPDRRARGEAGYRGVYGSQAESLRGALKDTHPALPDLVVEVGYGWMMARPGLPPDVRECCMVSMLIPTGALSPLYSHLRGALRLGATPEHLEEAIGAGLAAAAGRIEGGVPSAEDVWETWRRVARRSAPDDQET